MSRVAVHRVALIVAVARRASLAAALLVALSLPLSSASQAAGTADPAIGFDGARHLLARTGFGATAAEIAAFAPLSREQAVDRILAGVRTTAVTAPPAFATEDAPLAGPRPGMPFTADERRAFRREQTREGLALRAWWIGEMLATSSPLTERLTLFWHNHFVSSQQKVVLARLMYAQNATFRRFAAGDFRALLHAAAKEPAMVRYLDAGQNRKGAPNENFAREVMELFTLGEGRYTEQDVREAARAFTGWGIDRTSGMFVDRPRLHDDGEKVIFGKRGRFDGDDVLDLILARPQTSRFIVAKLWREFVSPQADVATVERIATRFRASHYDVATALRALFLSPQFWAPENRGTLVRSPIEIVVGSLHTLGLAPRTTLPFALAAAGMGQNLFSPPNVKGWPGGERWIDTSTLLARKQFLEALARPRREATDGASDLSATQPAGDTTPAPAGDMPRTRADDMTANAAPASARAPAAAGEPDATATRRARAARAIAAALAATHFDAAAWADALPGADLAARLELAEQVLLPLRPVTPDVAEARAERDPVLLVRASLLDPVYELK